jgi:hypothetical protein
MRTFVHGTGPERKFITIEVKGRRMAVVRGQPDGSLKRDEKELPSDAEAAHACDLLATQLLARGYVEQKAATAPTKAVKSGSAIRPAPAPAPAARPAAPARKPVPASAPDEDEPYALSEALDEVEAAAPPVLPRMAVRPGGATAETGSGEKSAAKPKKKKKKKRKKDGEGQERLFFLGVAGMGVAVIGVIGFLVWDLFFKPGTLPGQWEASRTEYEIGKSLTHDVYKLNLDAQKHAVWTHNDSTMSGTYTTKGDHLLLSVKDEELSQELEFRFKLGQTTLDLFEPATGKKVVQLVKMSEASGSGSAPAASGSGQGAAPAAGALPEGDAGLATQDFGAKDGSFACKYPPGWETKGGAAGDNSFGWGSFEKDYAKIKIEADVAGSLMSGIAHPHGDQEGEEPPVVTAHNLNKKKVADSLEKYQESDAQAFKSEGLGDGRIAEFTAGGGGLFGSKIHGYRATLLSNDRRVGILCQCPEKEWSKYKPIFFAVIKSLRH